ncbi:MAG TPA: FAD binding domain-containing protein [Verrucomicrobiae bacterium]|nr:FAD binding domain-containing protein [Verrucomicrobiae bacterium]
MKSFEYAAPKTIEDAIGLLSDKWGETEVLAGGTDLVTCMKQQIAAPKRLVSLKNLSDLKGIKTEGKAIHIGATTTLGELVANASVQEHFPALVTAAKSIMSPQLLTLGTVGGELLQRPRCWYYRNNLGLFSDSLVREGDNRYHAIFGNSGPALFVHPSSLAPVFVALGATMVVTGAKGKKREVAAAKFFQTPKSEQERESTLKPNEILAAIQVPISGLKNAVYEVRHRQAIDWPYVTAAVAFASKGGSASDARVVLGHVAPVPWVSPNAAKALNGGAISDAGAAKVGDAATQGAKPLSKNEYKIQLVRAAVKRAVLAAGAA